MPGEGSFAEEPCVEDLIIKDPATSCCACIIISSFRELYSGRISAIDPDFTGASLVAVLIDKVWFGLYCLYATANRSIVTIDDLA